MRKRGFIIDDILKSAFIDKSTLNKSDEYISYNTYKYVLHECILLCEDRTICAEIGFNIHLSDHGLLGYALMSANTLNMAIHTFANYYHLRMIKTNFTISTDGINTGIKIEEPFPMDKSDIYVFDAILFAIINMATLIFGSENNFILSLSFMGPDNGRHEKYKYILEKRNISAEIFFNSPCYIYSIANHNLAKNTRFGDQFVAEAIEKNIKG